MRQSEHSAYSYLDAMDDLRGMTVVHGEFVVVTSEGADCETYAPFSALLARVKSSLALDVLFVSQSLDGVPAPRPVRRGAGGKPCCDVEEVQYGHAVLDMQALARDGTDAGAARECLSTPVVANDGFSYGTLCCTPRGATATGAEVNALSSLAQMIGHALAERIPGLATLN